MEAYIVSQFQQYSWLFGAVVVVGLIVLYIALKQGRTIKLFGLEIGAKPTSSPTIPPPSVNQSVTQNPSQTVNVHTAAQLTTEQIETLVAAITKATTPPQRAETREAITIKALPDKFLQVGAVLVCDRLIVEIL